MQISVIMCVKQILLNVYGNICILCPVWKFLGKIGAADHILFGTQPCVLCILSLILLKTE